MEFDWHHSIADPENPLDTCQNVGDISCTSRVEADFGADFVAMATRVGLKFE